MLHEIALSAVSQQAAVPLQDQPLVILVGVTGVGKSTTLEALSEHIDLALLPNRRALTDVFIFAGETVNDRSERFRRTAAFREKHAGGMSEILQALCIDTLPESPLFFDGIRGLDEVAFAAQHLKARFVLLDAPDRVRVQRLLGRGDAFDQIQGGSTSQDTDVLAQLQALAGIEQVFSAAELQQIAALPEAASDIISKVTIVLNERQNYSPKAANDYLTQHLPAQRVLYLDTVALNPEQVAQAIQAWL